MFNGLAENMAAIATTSVIVGNVSTVVSAKSDQA